MLLAGGVEMSGQEPIFLFYDPNGSVHWQTFSSLNDFSSSDYNFTLENVMVPDITRFQNPEFEFVDFGAVVNSVINGNK